MLAINSKNGPEYLSLSFINKKITNAIVAAIMAGSVIIMQHKMVIANVR
jgi:hypothetical protein